MSGVRSVAAFLAGAGAEAVVFAALALSPLPNGSLLEGPGDARWQTLLAAAAFAALVLVVAERRLAREPLALPAVLVPLAALLGWTLLQLVPLPLGVLRALAPATAATFAASYPDAAWAEISQYPALTRLEALRLAAVIAAIIVVVNRVRTSRDSVRWLVVITLVGVGMTIVAFVQRATSDDPFLLLWTWRLERWGTPFGPYINKNHFAGLMEITMGAALGLTLGGLAVVLSPLRGMSLGTKLGAIGARPGGRVIVPLVAFGLMGAGLVASLSRGGVIAMLAALAVFTVWLVVRHRLLAAWAVLGSTVLAVVAASAILGPGNVENRLTLQPRAINRVHVWRDALAMVGDHPIAGTGAGTFLYAHQRYHDYPDKRLATHAESDWLQLWSGLGTVGMALLAWAGWRFGRAVRAGLAGEPTAERLALVGVLVGILSILLHGFLDVNLQIPANGFHFAVLAALALAASARLERLGHLEPMP